MNTKGVVLTPVQDIVSQFRYAHRQKRRDKYETIVDILGALVDLNKGSGVRFTPLYCHVTLNHKITHRILDFLVLKELVGFRLTSNVVPGHYSPTVRKRIASRYRRYFIMEKGIQILKDIRDLMAMVKD